MFERMKHDNFLVLINHKFSIDKKSTCSLQVLETLNLKIQAPIKIILKKITTRKHRVLQKMKLKANDFTESVLI